MSNTVTTIIFYLFLPAWIGLTVIFLFSALRDGIVGGIVRLLDELR